MKSLGLCCLFVPWLLFAQQSIDKTPEDQTATGLQRTVADRGELSVAAFSSIQAALDAHPGRVMWVPAGDYPLTEAIVIRHSDSGLCGPGRLIQSNPNAPIIKVQDVTGVRLADLTLTRAADRLDARASAVSAVNCERLALENLCVLDNRSAAAVIRLDRCRHADVVRCHVRNYMTIAVDDRTASPHFGYAFNCIDGTGITIDSCQDVLLQGNRVIEENLRPTREMKDRYQLGQFVKRAAVKGSLMNQETWDKGYVNNWHQGSGIVVTGPEKTAYVRLVDNHVENAAQGIDIHADYVTVSGNFVVNAFMGMKAMHGSRHVVITNNQFVRNDLWSIGLMPGTAAHGSVAATEATPMRAANVDGSSVIANNIISEFGYGDSHWIWNPQQNTCAPLVFDRGQESDDPPLSDVIVAGNIVYDPGRLSGEGMPAIEPPRYRWAIYVSTGPGAPRGLHFSHNLFHPGTEGIANVTLGQ